MVPRRRNFACGVGLNVAVFPFLHLPQELQDKVYGYLLTREGQIRHLSDRSLFVEHNSFDTTVLRVNKEVYASAVQVLYSSNRVCFLASGHSDGRLEGHFPTVLLHHLRNAILTYTLIGESQASHFDALTDWLHQMSNLRVLRLKIEESDPRFCPYGRFQDRGNTIYMYKPLNKLDMDYLQSSIMPMLTSKINLQQCKITWPMSNGQGMEKFRDLLRRLEEILEGKEMLGA